jgi:quercetin dioxygenase-like cupin family protein
MSQTEPFADFIKALPQADIPMEGPLAYLLTGGPCQVVFFDLPAGSEVPPHSHGAQWGIVVDGELELTIGGQNKTYRQGDSYFIGDGVVHSGKIESRCQVIDVFADADRYQPKD